MPKKMGVNSKAEAARARKTATEADRKEREAREKEEQYWREAEGAKSRAAKKREEEAEKRAEAAAKKAEARRLAEQEAKDLEKSMKKPDKKANRVSVPVPKVTEAELIRRREEEQAALQRRAEEDKKKQNRIADEEEYERMVSVVNTNRDDSVIEARTVEEAIARMTVADTLPVDKHPEKRLKASFKAFEEAELPKLKEEKPGLTHTQYKDMIWKLWKKSPDNPLTRLQPVRMVPFWCCGAALQGHIKSLFLDRGAKAVNGRRIIVGLKSDNCSREMLLRACSMVVVRGDSLLAVHVEQSDDTFDPNTFHIHEDLCKSNQVDFEIKICTGSCYVNGTEPSSPGNVCNDSCSWVQQKMAKRFNDCQMPESIASYLPASSNRQWRENHIPGDGNFTASEGPQQAVMVQELTTPTESFGSNVLIGEGARSRVYQATLENGQAVAVKVLKTSRYSEESFFQEVDTLSGLKHKNIVQLLGHCYGKEMLAIVYNLHSSSLKRRLISLKWSGRIQIALGVAKALEYLHSCCPPIIHKAARSLLTCGLYERLIDPSLNGDYNKEEMKAMMNADASVSCIHLLEGQR
ncbi:UNVERIFIED_CONTAM: Coiled-coil domain-containing protein [Sesamum radiatum]|uniref:Coiled-coil domain-containing protein n=1 Tax=Sesamum radiatum TaxID=300843 RepID=A0AAW2RUE8_SESRA